MFMEGLRKLEYKKYKPRLGGGKVGSDLREVKQVGLHIRPIQSIIRVFLCRLLFSPSIGDRNQESWRLLVKEQFAKIAKLRKWSLKKKTAFFSTKGKRVF